MTGEGCKSPVGPVTKGEEASKLYGNMAAFSGTYQVDGSKLLVRVESSWNESWTETEQVRHIDLKEGQLTLSTDSFKSPQLGKEVVLRVTYDRIE